jgi:hypothetical protein
LRDTHDKKSCHSVTHASLACKTPVCAYSPQASISRSYKSKAKRGWKLGRRDTAPTHDQRLVSHTPVAPTSASSPYFSILGPATRRRAQHHPLRVRPLPSARPHSHGPGFQPSRNIQKYPKTITDCLKILQRNATKVSGSRLPFGPWACKIPSPMLSKLRTPSPCHHGHPLDASRKKKALGTPSKALANRALTSPGFKRQVPPATLGRYCTIFVAQGPLDFLCTTATCSTPHTCTAHGPQNP